jgi:sulfite reductase beta subunit-like hemoprotein
MTIMSEPKESKVEAAKKQSGFLRGTIAETLESGADHFSDTEVQLLKFHGAYQQDDRDQRRELRSQGGWKAYQFMVRMAIPGGRLGAGQYLSCDELADKHANGSLRITTRQGFQLHGVLKKDLKETIASINGSLLTTLGACGDVERNVVACPAPMADPEHLMVSRLAKEIATELRPASKAYHEIWVDGEKMLSTEPEEPFYGSGYLPRKFKTGIALSTDNCVDVYSDDCGLVAVLAGGAVSGFNLLVGGGMGMTHGKPDTFARLAEPVGFIGVEHAVEAVRTVAAIFRDHGNREDRRHARIKYLIASWGMDRFREEFRRRVSFELEAPVPLPEPVFHDHLGRHPEAGHHEPRQPRSAHTGPLADGRWFYGIFVENGRIADRPGHRLKAALRSVVAEHEPGISLTPQQNILLTGLTPDAVDKIEATLRAHGVKAAGELSAARRYSLACPALPTCGLALSDAERLMPSVLDRFEAELASLGLRDAPITLRMTGCPNGCARPYTADIAFVGRGPGVYHVYVGGGLSGDRVADLFAADVRVEDFVTVLHPLLESWAAGRGDGEGLGDYYQRLLGRSSRKQSVTGKEEPTSKTIGLPVLPSSPASAMDGCGDRDTHSARARKGSREP